MTPEFVTVFLFVSVLSGQDADVEHFDSLIKGENYTQAAAELTAYAAAHPNSWQAFYQLGYADFRLHRIQDSLTALCKSLVLNRNAAESHKILAYDLNILGHQDLAVRELNEAIRCNPSSAESHYELGRIYYEQGLYLRSIEELEKSRSLAPRFVRVYHNLGLAYYAVGQNQKAIENFEQGLSLNSSQTHPSAWPLIDYATYLNMQDEFAKARELLLQAIQMDHSWDQAYSELAKAYRGLNQPEQAIAALQQAVALNAEKPEYHYVLARLYTQTNHPEEAKHELAAFEKYKVRQP